MVFWIKLAYVQNSYGNSSEFEILRAYAIEYSVLQVNGINHYSDITIENNKLIWNGKHKLDFEDNLILIIHYMDMRTTLAIRLAY